VPRPFTLAQHQQNRAFLRLLSQTGNVRRTCDRLGLHRALFTRRRAKHPGFAAEWDAALAIAHARLRQPEQGAAARAAAAAQSHHHHRTPGGRVQLRRTGSKRRLDHAAEQAFLAALSATANIRLSAAAAGFSHSAFYQRARTDPGFAREMRIALQIGYDRVEAALLAAGLADSEARSDWRHNDLPPIPPMTANQALQLLYLHQKEARLLAEPPHLKQRRGESAAAHRYRLAVMFELRQQRARDAWLIAEHERRSRGEPWVFGPEHLPPRPVLPDLSQVTGWSKAKVPKEDYDETRALFGGWRLKDWEG
jgi:hypothetical protein